MILSKPDIVDALSSGLVVNPEPASEQIDQISINLRLGREFVRFRRPPAHYAAIRVKPSIFQAAELWESVTQDRYSLESGGFVLAQTLERVAMPNYLMGFVEGRSSWARVGVSIHLTAPKIDPGFHGNITLEILNMGPSTVQLVAEEDDPAQLILMELTTPLEQSETYGSEQGHIFQYQNKPIPRKPGYR